KLQVLGKYLESYTTALKKTSFQKLYIDAFAGTGYRDARRHEEESQQSTLFPDMVEAEPQSFLDGSARLALQVEPRFDHYVFIERSLERCALLESLKSEFLDM